MTTVGIRSLPTNDDPQQMLTMTSKEQYLLHDMSKLTEEAASDEYFDEIDSVATIVEFGPTCIQKFGNGF